MIINLQVTPEETNKILTGLELFKDDLSRLANRIVEDANRQIAEIEKNSINENMKEAVIENQETENEEEGEKE